MDEVDRLITVLNQQFNVLDNNTDIGYVRDTSAALKAKVRGLYSVAPDEIRGDLEELGRALNLLVGAGDSARSVEDYQSLLAENQPALRVFDASLVKINRWYKPRCLRTN